MDWHVWSGWVNGFITGVGIGICLAVLFLGIIAHLERRTDEDDEEKAVKINEFILVFVTGLVALAFLVAVGLGLIWLSR